MAFTATEDSSLLEQLPFKSYYLYSPLPDNSFRLLRLDPGEGSDGICGHLIEESLDVGPQYEAISYHWEDRSGQYIMVDGFVLLTTRSAALALQQVRRQDEARRVWIDVVCINQDDLLERSQQVNMMGRIYSNASQVLICMNEGGKSNPKELLEEIQASFEPVDRIPGYPNPMDSFFTKDYSDLSTRDFGDEVHQLSLFLSNPWFSRVWVMQEVGLSRRACLFCDDWSIPWETFMFAASFFNAQGPILKVRYALHLWKIFPLTKTFWQPKSQGDLLEILIRTQDMKATDPRDKIFALLSHPWALTSDGLPTPVQPDYRKSVDQVYFEVACSLMNGPRPLRVLSAIHHRVSQPKCSIGDMSWVPQWFTKLPGYGYLFGTDVRFKCSMATSARFAIHDARKSLEIQGLLFDRISYARRTVRTSWIKGSHNFTNHIPAIWAELSEPEGGVHPYPASKSSVRDAYLQTLTASNSLWYRSRRTSVLVPNSNLDEALHQARLNFDQLGIRKSICSATRRSLVEELSVRDKAVLYFIEQTLTACRFRGFFKSCKGFYGLGPEAAEEDDVICIPFGSSVPFILRPDGSSGNWKMVGECYVHGIMNGEGIQMWEEGLVEEQTFHIV